MVHVRAIAKGVLRFAVAMVVGLFLLMVVTSVLHSRPPRVARDLFVLGLGAVWVAAARLAFQGKPTTFDRAAGTAAAAALAVIFGGVALAGMLVIGGLMLLSLLAPFIGMGHLAGPGPISLASFLAFARSKLCLPVRRQVPGTARATAAAPPQQPYRADACDHACPRKRSLIEVFDGNDRKTEAVYID